VSAARGPQLRHQPIELYAEPLPWLVFVELTHGEKMKREKHPTKALYTPLPLSI